MADVYLLETKNPDLGFCRYIESVPSHLTANEIPYYIDMYPDRHASAKHLSRVDDLFSVGGPANPIKLSVHRIIDPKARKEFGDVANVVVHAMIKLHFKDKKNFHLFKLTYPDISKFLVYQGTEVEF